MRCRPVVSLSLCGLVGVLVAYALPAAAQTEAAATPAPTQTESAPARIILVQAPERPSLPFRLGIDFGLVHSRSGALPYGDQGAKPLALGVDLAIGAGDVARIHFGVAHEWESEGRYSAKGLRLDLVGLGFPILLVADPIELHVEPMMRLARGEILSPQGSETTFFRIDTGLALLTTVAYKKWFFGFEPVVVDFRFFGADTEEARTGFTTLWWLTFELGREF